MPERNHWQPTASLQSLRDRAAATNIMRAFFAARGVLEVETPLLLSDGVTDVHTDSLGLPLGKLSAWLRTSPEYHMKRLLAAHGQDIYQLGKVFRGDESGERHLPEFTMLEWYRIGFSLDDLIAESCEFLTQLIPQTADQQIATYTYREAFLQTTGIDPLTASTEQLAETGAKLIPGSRPDGTMARHDWLDLLASTVVYPQLAGAGLMVISNYPAAQAMLARLNPNDPGTAQRFEVFCGGLELANGYCELTDPDEQLQRFATDNEQRRLLGKSAMSTDRRLIDALRSGLPDCSGVAIGVERVLMLRQQHRDISATVSFPPLS